MTAHAQLIEKRHSKTCEICMLLDTEAGDMKWHLWKVTGVVKEEEHYICDECLNGIMDIRKKCHEKVDNPHHEKFTNYTPWFIKQIPGMVESFRRNVTENPPIAHG